MDRDENVSPPTASKENSGSTKKHVKNYDVDWIRHTNAQRFLVASQQHVMKKPVNDQGCQKRLSKYNGIVNKMSANDVDGELQKRRLSTSGSIEIRRVRLKHFYKAQIMLKSDNPLPLIEQNFEYIAVIDFEATCDLNQGDKFPHEIIEFPIVLIHLQKREIVDQFRSYCRPTLNPILTRFCMDLTGIQQQQVDAAPVFSDVLQQAENWLTDRNLIGPANKRRCAFATDGPWDFAKFLRLQCRFSSVPYPRWARKWINIRKEFSNFYSIRRCGINNMLQNLGLTFDGRHHSGLDDSTNIARIALELIKDGCVLLLNDGIRAENPKFVDLNVAKSSTEPQSNSSYNCDENEPDENACDYEQDDFDD